MPVDGSSSVIPRLRTFVEKVAASRPGSWYILNVSARVDPMLLKATGGRLSTMPGAPILLLRHTGGRTGKIREAPLVYLEDGQDLVLIASKGGAPSHPQWYRNLLANPECEVIAKGRSGRYYAREATGARRDRLWDQAVELYSGYRVYQERAGGRRVPVVVLSPVD
jgi:deazaflavin-dependent oxidoreductase (nitroreductase family)